MSGRLGELLVRENLDLPAAAAEGPGRAAQDRRPASARCSSSRAPSRRRDLTNFLSKQYGVPAISLNDFDVDDDVIKLVPRAIAEKHQVLPVNRAGSSLIVAMSDPSNIFAIDEIKFHTGYNIEPVVASEQAIREAIERYYREGPLVRGADAGLRRLGRRPSIESARTTATSSTSRRAPARRRSSSS